MGVVAKYEGPFEGIDIMSPQSVISQKATPSCSNIFLRENFIQTRPQLVSFLPTSPDGTPWVGMTSAWNGFGTYYIYGFTANNAYILNSGNVWSSGTGTTFPTPGGQVDYVGALGSLIFVNGTQHVFQIVNTTMTTLTDLYGAMHIMELAQTLLICHTFEADGEHPVRIRWCNAGNVTQWDPSLYTGAGFNDLLDVSDEITGTLTIGSIGYVLRKNGITQVTPTGNGIQPWYFNHLWASQHGIGLHYPHTESQYGSLGFLLAYDNVYIFTPSSVDPIGDRVMDQIVSDLELVDITTNANVFAFVHPNVSGGYRHFCYSIFIVLGYTPGMIVWTYDIDKKNWVRWTTQTLSLTTKPNVLVGSFVSF